MRCDVQFQCSQAFLLRYSALRVASLDVQMELNEFMVEVKPAKQRSKLKPHRTDIVKLREQGYTLNQVCDFLARNGVTTSPSNVASYLRRGMARGQAPHQGASAASKSHADAPAPASPAEAAKPSLLTPIPRAPVKPLEPGELRAIARNRPDLNELARLGREAIKAERSRKA